MHMLFCFLRNTMYPWRTMKQTIFTHRRCISIYVLLMTSQSITKCNYMSLLRNGLFNIKYITIHFQTIACFHIYHNIALENGRLSNNINTVFLCLETSTKVFKNRWYDCPYDCDACTYKVILNSLDIDFTRDHINGRSYKTSVYFSTYIQFHYGDVIMGTMASQITSLIIVYATVHSGADQRNHQSFASLAFVRGIHRGITRKMFQFDDVIMLFVRTICRRDCSRQLDGFRCQIRHMGHPSQRQQRLFATPILLSYLNWHIQ